ncbi:MAG: YheV family putative zinc ribbon protein [Halieaceae bacterium]|nr:YheV family putative zinc ribbon protein [Halieaceae bacterium]
MTRRFIAGAVCPRCGEMDKIVVDSETDQRECVSCGYQDQRPTQAQSELRTRVNRPSRRVEAETEAVTLVMPHSPADKTDA